MDSVVFPSLPTYLFEPSLAGVLSLALTVLLPLLAAVLMRSNWSAFKKGLVLLGLAAVKAFLEAWIGHVESGEYFDFFRAGYAVLINFGIAVSMYFGLLRGTDIQQAAIRSGVKPKTIDGTVVS
ncbi:hypothetical protein [Paractinoplanes toevensis]|uniref:Uncharacterized protein n=1 Tax=Paractinoplanes toevensis TaxID=571911 RepID=A0A919T484_9ACTN|nr:hypothetical protein [Actinoplanes toevensis]GIM88740.1 hypothetical protein Ato02nite_005330 [Actinoplanes toevensis]